MLNFTMIVPVHQFKKVGKYKIISYLSANEVHVTCKTDSVGPLYHQTFNITDEEGFTKCFNDLVLVAEIKTSLQK